ncbi:hypothetical protein R8510_04748 [Ralstonia chuxiongensis]|nr:hypothetical protein R8510_04748 [Ralstonia chuxiongensis]
MRKKRGRKPLDPALPRVEVRHGLPESERGYPNDGQALIELVVEVSEQLDTVPQQIRVIKHQRVKYACPCCDGGMRRLLRSFKTELFYPRNRQSTTIEQFIQALDSYIRWYNEKRIKLSLGALSPAEYPRSLGMFA